MKIRSWLGQDNLSSMSCPAAPIFHRVHILAEKNSSLRSIACTCCVQCVCVCGGGGHWGAHSGFQNPNPWFMVYELGFISPWGSPSSETPQSKPQSAGHSLSGTCHIHGKGFLPCPLSPCKYLGDASHLGCRVLWTLGSMGFAHSCVTFHSLCRACKEQSGRWLVQAPAATVPG